MELQEETRKEILAFGGKCYLMKVSKDWAEEHAAVGLREIFLSFYDFHHHLVYDQDND